MSYLNFIIIIIIIIQAETLRSLLKKKEKEITKIIS